MNAGEQRWLLKAIRETGSELESRFLGLPEEAFHWRPFQDEWCLCELMGHLRDYEGHCLTQLRLMISRNNPRLDHIDIEDWPAEKAYARQSVRRFSREFAEQREETVELLWMIMDDWELYFGEHPYRRRVTATDLVRDLNKHDLTHLFQANQLVGGYEKAQGLPTGALLG